MTSRQMARRILIRRGSFSAIGIFTFLMLLSGGKHRRAVGAANSNGKRIRKS